MASPLPDGSFDIAEIVLLATPSSSIWLGPPKVALAGSRFAKAKPVASQIQMSAGNQPVLVPGGRVNRRTNLALAAPAKKIELRYKLRGITIRSIPSRAGRALTAISPLVEGSSHDSPGRSEDQRRHCAQYRVPRASAARAGMFRRTSATPAGQSKAAVAQRSDRCPVRPAETAMRHGVDQCALSLPKVRKTTGLGSGPG